ncbi:transposase [Acetobacter aceti]|uniref:transposase n=1 Tax=Acetobacter aceti TaxID=435 RepID=UPI0038D22B66
MVDTAGKAVALSLGPGQRADIAKAAPLLDEAAPKAFIADKPYDAESLIEKLRKRQIAPVIPSRKKRLEMWMTTIKAGIITETTRSELETLEARKRQQTEVLS